MKENGVRKHSVSVLMAVFLMFAICLLSAKPVCTFAASDAPGRVKLQKVTIPAYGQVKITWKKATNATAYYIYYKEATAGKWKKLASVKSDKTGYIHKTSAKYPLTNGKTYSYTVKAYNSISKKTGAYDKKGMMVQILPETVKLKTANVNADQISVNLTWSKAKGCDSYDIYRRTYRSAWKMVARVKGNVLKYTDPAPRRGWANYYTVCGYDSRTDTSGNRSNIISAVLDSPVFTFPTVRAAYVDVLRGIQAGDSRDLFEGLQDVGTNIEYFVYDINKDGIPELIVGCDRIWDEEDKSYIRKFCQVYECMKTSNGYQTKKQGTYLWDPQLCTKGNYLFENYYWYSKAVNLKHICFIENGTFKKYGEILQYTVGSKELKDFDARNPMPVWTKITDTSALNGL